MKIEILNEFLNYEIKEVGNIDGILYAKILIEDYEKEEITSAYHKNRYILKRITNELLIPISEKTFQELNAMLGKHDN